VKLTWVSFIPYPSRSPVYTMLTEAIASLVLIRTEVRSVCTQLFARRGVAPVVASRNTVVLGTVNLALQPRYCDSARDYRGPANKQGLAVFPCFLIA